jgi:transcriptional regulator with XRE-family HTH domain
MRNQKGITMKATHQTGKKPVKQADVDFDKIRSWLRELRDDRKMTLTQLAEKTGYSKEFIKAIEKGEVDIDITLLFRLLDAMDCDITLRKRNIQARIDFQTQAKESLKGSTNDGSRS